MGKDAPHHARDEEPAPVSTSKDDPVCCAACGHVLSRRSMRLERDGSHEHGFLNPAGLPFKIALFSDAPGTAAYGERSSFFAWFAGHEWQVAICARCSTHVGWSFHGASTFVGLIVDRIR